MDKKRLQAYHALINSLLDNSGEEVVDILNSHCHLLDGNFIKILLEITANLVESKNLASANKLMNVSVHILSCYNLKLNLKKEPDYEEDTSSLDYNKQVYLLVC
jgi:hypothetical protein